jgi:hypothetical protein
MFKLEAMNAKYGDCLLLHYGDGKIVLIDAGPATVYRNVLEPRLEELRGGGNKRLSIRLAMVSHIDDDHIHGILDMLNKLKQAQDDNDVLKYDIVELWHNSFKDGMKVADASFPAEVAANVSPSGIGDGIVPAGNDWSEDFRADLASVGQGGKVRDLAKALALDVNSDFDKLVMAKAGDYPVIDLGDGLTLQVLGPSAERLELLKKEWAKKTAAQKADPAEVADYVEKTASNLSSIVVMANFDGKRMLLTGDSRGDDVLAGLEGAGLLAPGGTIELEVLKVPHHGSWRNLASDFFERIRPDHYVFSADGKYGNPDEPTLQALVAARGDDDYTIWLTNHVQHADDALAALKPGRAFTVEVREEPARSVVVAP